VSFKFPIYIILLKHCAHTHTVKLEVIYFSIGIRAGILRLKDLVPKCDPYLFVTSIFLLHLLSWNSLSSLKKIMILSPLKFLLNWIKLFIQNSSKVKQEKESLIVQLSESHVLIDSLRSENTMLFDIIDTVENKLKESEDLLKRILK
jgi:hypothetical protein